MIRSNVNILENRPNTTRKIKSIPFSLHAVDKGLVFIGTWIFCVHQQLQLQMWCIAVCVVRETVLWSCTSKLFIYELFCCHSSLLNGQVIFCLGKCVILAYLPGWQLGEKPICYCQTDPPTQICVHVVILHKKGGNSGLEIAPYMGAFAT